MQYIIFLTLCTFMSCKLFDINNSDISSSKLKNNLDKDHIETVESLNSESGKWFKLDKKKKAPLELYPYFAQLQFYDGIQSISKKDFEHSKTKLLLKNGLNINSLLSSKINIYTMQSKRSFLREIYKTSTVNRLKIHWKYHYTYMNPTKPFNDLDVTINKICINESYNLDRFFIDFKKSPKGICKNYITNLFTTNSPRFTLEEAAAIINKRLKKIKNVVYPVILLNDKIYPCDINSNTIKEDLTLFYEHALKIEKKDDVPILLIPSIVKEIFHKNSLINAEVGTFPDIRYSKSHNSKNNYSPVKEEDIKWTSSERHFYTQYTYFDSPLDKSCDRFKNIQDDYERKTKCQRSLNKNISELKFSVTNDSLRSYFDSMLNTKNGFLAKHIKKSFSEFKKIQSSDDKTQDYFSKKIYKALLDYPYSFGQVLVKDIRFIPIIKDFMPSFESHLLDDKWLNTIKNSVLFGGVLAATFSGSHLMALTVFSTEIAIYTLKIKKLKQKIKDQEAIREFFSKKTLNYQRDHISLKLKKLSSLEFYRIIIGLGIIAPVLENVHKINLFKKIALKNSYYRELLEASFIQRTLTALERLPLNLKEIANLSEFLHMNERTIYTIKKAFYKMKKDEPTEICKRILSNSTLNDSVKWLKSRSEFYIEQ